MKRNIILISIAAALACSTAAQAADGTINFTGSINTDGCGISVASASQTVNLGGINTSAFKNAVGEPAGATRFTIDLSACPTSVSSANVKFDGPTNSVNSDLLALSSGQTATGVGIGIYESNGTTLIPMQTATAPINLTSGNASAVYIAKYVSTATTVTAGSANAVANFTIMYN